MLGQLGRNLNSTGGGPSLRSLLDCLCSPLFSRSIALPAGRRQPDPVPQLTARALSFSCGHDERHSLLATVLRQVPQVFFGSFAGDERYQVRAPFVFPSLLCETLHPNPVLGSDIITV
jgi:hypothetical protein